MWIKNCEEIERQSPIKCGNKPTAHSKFTHRPKTNIIRRDGDAILQHLRRKEHREAKNSPRTVQ